MKGILTLEQEKKAHNTIKQRLNEIDKKSNVIRKVNLKDKIEFTVLSKLGELEENEHEKFIPLEVHDIL